MERGSSSGSEAQVRGATVEGHAPLRHGPAHAGHHGHDTTGVKVSTFVIAIALNTLFVLVQFGFGLAANSTALIADAGHNLSDVLGLVVALGGALLARRAPSARFTYGLRSASILAALANAMLLLVACGAIAWEAVQRMFAPPPVAGLTVTLVAGVGILVNGLSARLFLRGSRTDLNVRGAYLHMAADAAVSLGVVVAGLVMMGTGWYWLDPVVSLVIVVLVVLGTWGLLGESTRLILSAVPAGIDPGEVAGFLRRQPGVSDVHDVHIWGMSTTEVALTAHLVIPGGYPGDAVLDGITADLCRHFGIAHCTLQVEQGTVDHDCSLHRLAR